MRTEAHCVAPFMQVGKLEDEKRQLERKLKQSLSEQDHLSEHNSYLTGEIDRWVRVMEKPHMVP